MLDSIERVQQKGKPGLAWNPDLRTSRLRRRGSIPADYCTVWVCESRSAVDGPGRAPVGPAAAPVCRRRYGTPTQTV